MNTNLPEIDLVLLESISAELSSFIMSLASEGERSAVVLGAARLDVALEKLLITLMHHHPDGTDNLFDPDRPLGSLSAKIALAYRLGLVDEDFEHALQMIRRIRNDFAHSIAKSSLSDSPHKNRVDELTRDARKRSDYYPKMRGFLDKEISQPALLDFCTAIGVLLLTLEITRFLTQPVSVTFVSRLKT